MGKDSETMMILIAGASGAIGKLLTGQLLNRRQNVRVLCHRLKSCPKL